MTERSDEDKEAFQELLALLKGQKKEITKLRGEVDELKTERQEKPTEKRQEKYECSNCGKRFTEDEFKEFAKCPACGSETAKRI